MIFGSVGKRSNPYATRPSYYCNIAKNFNNNLLHHRGCLGLESNFMLCIWLENCITSNFAEKIKQNLKKHQASAVKEKDIWENQGNFNVMGQQSLL